MYEAAALSWVGIALGTFIDMKNMGKTKVKQMQWFEPKDDTALKYKQNQLFTLESEEKLIRIQEIETVLSSKKLSKQNENILINELITLQDEVGMLDGLDDAIRRSDIIADNEAASAATN